MADLNLTIPLAAEAQGGAAPVIFGAVVVVGVLLCLFGRKLVKPVMCMAFVVLGGAIAAAATYGRVEQPIMIGWVIGGAIAAMLLAWVLFRIWMGIALAAVLAAAIPLAAISMQGEMPEKPPIDGEVFSNFKAAVEEQAKAAKDDDERDPAEIRADVEEALQEQLRPIRTWWDELESGNRSIITLGGILGGLIGLFIGLIGPRFAASVLSSLLGSVLMLGGLARCQLPEPMQNYLPQSTTSTLIAMSLITLMGVIVQWTIFRRKADK